MMRNEMLDFCKAHFNEPVIVYTDVARLIGYGEDDNDCYYIVRHLNGTRGYLKPENHNECWYTGVGPCMSLRALQDQDVVIPNPGVNDEKEWNNFVRLDSWLAMNGAPKAEEFKLVLRK